jgi:tricarballylate dehydrogenase
MPPVFEGTKANTLEELADLIGLDRATFMQTMNDYNRSCKVGTFNHTVLDDCHTEDLNPVKSHWAIPITQAPFYAYPVKPGITFTYLGLKTDKTAAVHFSGKASPNLFAAGEIMAGNVLGKGYTAGVGMTIGTAYGRIAGSQAAQFVLGASERPTPEDAERDLMLSTSSLKDTVSEES